MRELQEETGYGTGELAYFRKVFVRYRKYDFVYHIFHTVATAPFTVKINPSEHKAYGWFTPQKSLELPLTPDPDACIRPFYDARPQ